MGLFFFVLIALLKAAIVRLMCANSPSQLTPNQESMACVIALLACGLPAIVSAGLVAFLIPFGMAFATRVVGDFYSVFTTTLLSLPLFYDWIVDIVIVMVCWTFYKNMKFSRIFSYAFIAYFAVVVFEYGAIIAVFMNLYPAPQ